MRPEPNTAFEIYTPDEVAECWEGVSDKLRCKLWCLAKLTPPVLNKEDTGPADHVGHGNLAALWDLLTEDEAKTLNELAEGIEATWEEEENGDLWETNR